MLVWTGKNQCCGGSQPGGLRTVGWFVGGGERRGRRRRKVEGEVNRGVGRKRREGSRWRGGEGLWTGHNSEIVGIAPGGRGRLG